MEYDEVKLEKKEERVDSYFDGKFFEYIGYKLLALIITLVSFFIAKPWADKLIFDYEINHTVYNGKRLKFEGKGSSLFVQRLKWFILTIITLGIYAWWIPIKMEKWLVSNIHFEDEQLIEGESYFDGKLIQMIGVNLFTGILTIISFGLLYPFGICYKQRWIAKHTIINRKKIKFDGKAVSLIGHYLLWYLLSIITVGIYAIWLPIKVYSWQVKRTHLKLKTEEEEKTSILPMLIGIVLIVLFLTVAVIIIPKTSIPEIVSGDKPINELFSFKKKQNYGINGESIYGSNSSNKTEINVTWDSEGGDVDLNKKYKIGDVITNIPTPEKSGYKFIEWNTRADGTGDTIKNGYVIYDEIDIYAIWEKVVTVPQEPTTPAKPTSKCNSGYTYDEIDNLCYLLSDTKEPVTVNEYDANGEIYASGIHCPTGYQINFELDETGMCLRFTTPN